MTPEYLLLGHLTRDLLPDGGSVPGGTALYAALTAQRLGARVALASARAELPPDWPAAIGLAWCEAAGPPVFENRYTPAGRTQLLHAAAPPLTLAAVPPAWRAAPVVHLGPVLDEVAEDLVGAFPGALLGVTPQGWMRTWPAQLPGPVSYRPWQPTPALLSRIGVLVLSIEDLRGDEGLARGYAQHCPVVALTLGAEGALVFTAGQPQHIPAFRVTERDPTGAGDVFAAALLLRLRETGDALVAARFAAATAALSITGQGAGSIPTRPQVEQLLAHDQ